MPGQKMSKKLNNIFEGVFTEISVDSESRTIRNAALVGQVSRNGRRYLPEALKAGAAKYEGTKVYVDHPDKNDENRGWRSVKDLAGKIENVRFDGQKIRGDIKLLSNAGGTLAFDIATSMPDVAGMSHNAFGKTRTENGVEIIESIERVISVDLVTEPATNNGFFEANLNDKTGDKKMDYSQVTMVGIKEARTDIVESLRKEGAASRDEEVKNLKAELEQVKADSQKKDAVIDGYKVKEAIAAKESTVERMLDESKLPAEAKTETFKNLLLSLTVKEGEEYEAKVKEYIDDRMTAVTGKGVKDNTERNTADGDAIPTPESVARGLKGPDIL